MIKQKNSTYSALILVVTMTFLSHLATAQTATTDALENMDRHWGKLIREQDPAKQKVLIEEHRKMMSLYSSKESLKKMHQLSSQEMMEHNMDVMNTVKMHKKIMQMLDMMH